MKFFLRFILILVLGFFALKFLPFWSVALVAFAVGLLLSKERKRRMFGKNPAPPFSFWAGFLAMFILWGTMAFLSDHQNASLLSNKIAQLLTQSDQPVAYGSYAMILTSALIGALLGGFGALSGNLLGEALKG